MKFLKQSILPVLLFAVVVFSTCKKSSSPDPEPQPVDKPKITSVEFKDDLLFVPSDSNKSGYQIQTSEPATFSSPDSIIRLSSSGVISRLVSGEIAAIDVSWTNRGTKSRIYALGAADNTYDKPFVNYHGASDTDPYHSYMQGWATLRKMPVAGETYAIVLRHADADNGIDYSVNHGRNDPSPAEWWKSCDSTLARQLNPVGRQRSVELGQVFKDLRLPIGRVVSSEFCRAVTTAKLINVGPPIQIEGRINHPAYNVSRQSLFKGLVAILGEQPVDKQTTLVVTHHPINEFANSGLTLPGFPNVSVFNWTGAYFVKIAADKSLSYEGAASWAMFKYWRDLKLGKL